jgi:molybdopterin-containing oxidoreductase family molybdopterin binding subunit
MFDGEPITVKSIITYATNHLATSPERKLTLATDEKIEFTIYVDCYMNETAQYSDLILPTPYWFEYETIASNNKFNDKAIEPLFETKSDVEIVCAIGRAMGFEGFDLTDESYCQLYYENDACREAGYNWDYFKEIKIYENPNPPEPYIYGNVDYKTVFTCKTGRASFFIENPTNVFDQTKAIDKKLYALPHVKPPNEAWPQSVAGFQANPLGEKYPLFLFTNHSKLKAHTVWSKCPQLVELDPEPTIHISPDDASARGIEGDDYLRVFNDRGSMIARARIDSGCRPGVLVSQHGWWTDQHVEGDKCNVLNSIAMDHKWPTLEHTDVLVEVEKYELKGAQ